MKKTLARILSVMIPGILLPAALLAQSGDSFKGDSFGGQKNGVYGNSNLEYLFETVGISGSGGSAPLWHTSNRQGLPSARESNGYLHCAVLGGMSLLDGLDVEYGIDLGAGAGLESDCFLHQMYVDVDYKWLELSLGMKERWGEFKNPALSSGGLSWSGNSRPIPQARLEVPDFVDVPGLGGWISFKGHVGYGFYTDGQWRKDWAGKMPDTPEYADGILHHSKSLFLRFGNEDRFPFVMTFGLEMVSQFGGTLHNMTMYGAKQDEYDLPSDLKAFWGVLLPFNKSGEQGWENGNSLGSWHLTADFPICDFRFKAYYEHFFEDHSSMLGVEYKSDSDGRKRFVSYGFKRNWFDGLFGLEIKVPDGLPVNNLVFEYLNTRGQCGSLCNVDAMQTERIDGRDGMYIHSKYLSYTHWGVAIGNPLLVSPVYNPGDGTVPDANIEGNLTFLSNRVRAFHLGLDGSVSPNVDYRILTTFTRHWGTYYRPLDKLEDITSLMLECSYRPGHSNNWKISLSGAMDVDGGNLLGNNKGLMLTISKKGKVL